MNEILSYPIIESGKYVLRVSNLLGLAILFASLIFVLFAIKKIIYRSQKFDEAKKFAIFKLFKYFLVILSVVIGLQILGFNVTLFLAGSAALLVGLGLGIQSLFSDFISGIIILIDRTIKVNDIIDVNGIVCKVMEINFRTTTVLTRDDKYIILPNSDFTKSQLINWTHSDIASRFEINVGVDYSSDVNLVMKLIQETAMANSSVLKTPKPFVRFNDYADSALVFTLYFWAEEVFRVENIKSDIRVKLYDAFQKNNVQIPFPQRVIHTKNI